MADLDELALALPEATKEVEEGRPVYRVHDKQFCFHRSPRKLLLSDVRGLYFTTPHWDGYAAVLLRIPDLARLERDELRDLVEEAWLTRAKKRLATEWVAERS